MKGKLNVSVSDALRRHGWVSGTISAVVVNGESRANPFEASVLVGVEVTKLFLVPPALALSGAELGFHGGFTTVDVEALVGGDEWCFGPVCLLKPTSRRPIICVP